MFSGVCFDNTVNSLLFCFYNKNIILYVITKGKVTIRMKQQKISEENAICKAILRYGKDILHADIFRQAAKETHHLHGSVADHTLNVCIISVRLCHMLQRRQIPVCEKDLILAALCHDLGMIGRSSRYHSRKDSWKSHPEESVRIAHTLIPDLSDSAEELIRTHMWPVAGPFPRTRESRLLGTADKYASMADWISWLTRRPFAARIKKNLRF